MESSKVLVLNKIVDDATVALESLFKALGASSGYDVEYIPNETSRKAYESLQKVLVAVNPDVVDHIQRQGLFCDMMEKIRPKLDSPAAQTALGSVATEFMGVFYRVQKIFQQKDMKKVWQKNCDMLERQ